MMTTIGEEFDSNRNGIEFLASGANIVKNLNMLGLHVSTAKEAFEKLTEAKPIAVKFFADLANHFVAFFSTLIYILNPQVIVIGGSVAMNNQQYFQKIFTRVINVTKDINYQTGFEFAQEMTENTLIGAVNFED
nr:ROK family protein [Spiroplasma clarkii]